MNKEAILNLLKEKGDPPPLPDILGRIDEEVNNPDSDISTISRLIDTEPVLAGKLVKLANSVFFGAGREKAQDLQSAVLRLGVKMVVELVFTVTLPGLLKPSQSFNQIQFWRHSLAVGCLARSIAKRGSSEVKVNILDDVYMAGLVHDMGILIFDFLIPDHYGAFLKERKADEALIDQEIATFGVSHAELGALYIKKAWPMSPEVILSVAEHHSEDKAAQSPYELTSVIYVANWIAKNHEMSNGIDVVNPSSVADEILDAWELSDEAIENLAEETRESVQAAEMLVAN
ncbi:MAG: HDOD domain-containing protein [Candidatus Nitrohelix vancouverensis]|uniref:HDOD domain-containing protein n=1 Tax=Candidatus Nitrohelix vancouverensis TaxID=2705534 RepID=A0A7T0C4S0_9BACT|nr:MAG: HDOD domain-containing protein [Candidatus Nitrohelix vancouverensis]